MSAPVDTLAAVRASGRLRIGLFPSFFYARSAAGEFSGWGIEMARGLAGGLGVLLELIERPSPPAIVEALRGHECDAVFIGITPERQKVLDFTAPWVEGEFTFLVPGDAPYQRIADLDRPILSQTALRIAIVAKHAMDAALDGQLTRAARVYADTPDAAFAMFVKREVDVLAGIRPGLSVYATKAAGTRILPDRYGSNVIGLAVRKGDAAWVAHVSRFVADSKASGEARAAAERCGAVGLEVLA